MKKFANFLSDFEFRFSYVLVVLLTVILFIQIVNRYVFSFTLFWLEEIARISFVWLIYFCVASAARENRHIRIGLIDMFLPKSAIRIVNFIADGIVICFSLIIAWFSLVLIQTTIDFDEKTAVTEFPMWIIYSVLPFCFTLIAVRMLNYNIRDLLGKPQKQVDEDSPTAFGD